MPERGGRDDALAARWAALGPAVLKAGKVAATDLELALANATLLLDAMGHAVVAWLWLDQALTANRALAAGDVRRAMLEGKVAAARYFIDWELPTKDAVLVRFASIDPLCRDLDPAVL